MSSVVLFHFNRFVCVGDCPRYDSGFWSSLISIAASAGTSSSPQEHNMIFTASKGIADAFVPCAHLHFQWMSFLSWNHWGGGKHYSHVIKIRYRQADRLRCEDFSVRPPLMCGGRPPFAVRCYVLLLDFGLVWIFIPADPHRT
jgi:hypothetical protein